MRFSAAYFPRRYRLFRCIQPFFVPNNTAGPQYFSLLLDEILSACHTLCRIFRFHQFNMQHLIQRQDDGFEPFTNNMRISDCLRAYAVQQNTNPVIVITAFTAHKGVYPPALFWGKRYRHSSGGNFRGGFGCPRLPCSFFVCSSVFLTEGFPLQVSFIVTLLTFCRVCV